MSSPRVGLALVDAGNQFQQLLRRDAEAAAAKAGVALTTVFTGEGFNDHLAALRAMLADPAGPPQAIVVMAVRDQGLGRLLRDAAALGVHWAFLNDTEDDLAAIAREHPAVCLTAVCVDEQAAGRIQGEHIRRLVPAGRRVLYVQGSPRSLTSRLRTAGMQEATAGSGVEVVLAGGEWARQRAAQTIHDWLRFCAGRRRAFDLVSCQNDDLALGVIEALASESQKAGRADLLRIPVTGCDGAPDVGERLVREGRLAATVVLPRVAAPAVELLARVLATGERPPLRVTHVPLSLPGIDELRVAV